MPERNHKQSNKLRNIPIPRGQGPAPRHRRRSPRPWQWLCAMAASQFLLPCLVPLATAEQPRPDVGEAFISNSVAEPQSAANPPNRPDTAPGTQVWSAEELLDPTSKVWAGAQGLLLRLEDSFSLLATDAIDSAGDALTAAASHPDGRIETFGLANCTALTRPVGHPAYALALARDGHPWPHTGRLGFRVCRSWCSLLERLDAPAALVRVRSMTGLCAREFTPRQVLGRSRQE